MLNNDSVFAKIAEALLADYTSVYYINALTNEYQWYSSDSEFHSLHIEQGGDDFFKNLIRDADKVIYEDDKHIFMKNMQKENLLAQMKKGTMQNIEYRLMIDGKPVYHALKLIRGLDEGDDYFILGVRNIDAEVRKEKERTQALDHANQLARRDGLTGTRNITAYHEFEKTIQNKINSGYGQDPFAILVCDINDLKYINDTQGHKKGDEYIRSACSLICDIFAHSPVFRIGGDEFVAFLSGRDFEHRDVLLDKLRSGVKENMKRKDGPIVAAGMAVYDPDRDMRISDVFNRADSRMYEDKTLLKESSSGEDAGKALIPEDCKRKLDALFEAFSIVAEGTYVYLCNMEYDYSRWSKTAVDTFGLPSEYMYGAGDIWEEHIHEEDRETYHEGIAAIFSGNALGHDMQYRARKINGEYDVCTCKGIVLKKENGESEYFGGAIRNHGVQSQIDTLTGLRNQYGFFEDIQGSIKRNKDIRIIMIGITKFSEINEIYSYRFGNMILQKFGRYLFEYVGNSGNAYRLDGTKFAILSSTRTVDEMRSKYYELRARYREGLNIDGRHILLELNAGLLSVDNFNIDYQTVCTCLNFAYAESKLRKHGDLVEFHNDLNYENKHSIEKLHAIRASITHGYDGFYLLYQPVVDAQTEKLIGAEALLRWKSSKYGMVPPDHFIPMLEKDPLFPELGEWILTKAINDAKKVLEDNPDFIINVNLSYTQLEKPDFVDMVLNILDKTGYPPEHLCLEVTERCRLLNITLLKNIAASLRGRGVQIALDDFGTGFSSVGIMKDIPFDIIKIDRTFVMRIEQDEKDRELIKSFISMASTYGAVVCVEGIENTVMRDILQGYGVHSFQGYYYAKPLELEDFYEWRKKRARSI